MLQNLSRGFDKEDQARDTDCRLQPEKFETGGPDRGFSR